MSTRFNVGPGLHEEDRLVLTRMARVMGVSVSDFIAWAVNQAIDPGMADILLAREFKPPCKPLEAKPLCKAKGCDKAQHARGFCAAHYENAYRTNVWEAA